MPGTTATQKLTYPVSTDLLKEQAQYLETLARQIDARASSHAASIASQTNRPFAILDATVQRQYPTSVNAVPDSAGFFDFDSVVVDTAGLVDLTASTKSISLNSTGTWVIGCYAAFTGLPGGSSCASLGSLTVNFHCDNGTPQTWGGYVKDFNTVFSYVHVSGLTRITSAGSPGLVYMDVDNAGTGCNTLINVLKARMWAFKAREL